MILLAALFAVVGTFASPVADAQGAGLMRRADTPNFYFVTTSSDPTSSLKPLRFDSTGYAATLTGTAAPIQFFFDGGDLKVVSTASPTPSTYISYSPTGTGCTTYGALNFVSGSSSNKCANHLYFYLQANTRMSSLGSQLVNNWIGEFWSCGTAQTIYYNSIAGAPTGLTCTQITLQTVPVTP